MLLSRQIQQEIVPDMLSSNLARCLRKLLARDELKKWKLGKDV